MSSESNILTPFQADLATFFKGMTTVLYLLLSFRNTRRAAEVWLDDYKSIYLKHVPSARYVKIGELVIFVHFQISLAFLIDLLLGKSYNANPLIGF